MPKPTMKTGTDIKQYVVDSPMDPKEYATTGFEIGGAAHSPSGADLKPEDVTEAVWIASQQKRKQLDALRTANPESPVSPKKK